MPQPISTPTALGTMAGYVAKASEDERSPGHGLAGGAPA
jgi:hypothetical protein